MLESRKNYTREVSLGHRNVTREIDNEHLEKMLEQGRHLRNSKEPIKCRVKLNRVWRASKEYIETTNRNRKESAEKGTLPPEVPLEVVDPYHRHWMPYFAIIPIGGITKRGYVKEVWIECQPKLIEIDNQSYELTDPFVHDTEQWIQGFMLSADDIPMLLPSPKIVVKYYRETSARSINRVHSNE